VAGVAIAQRLKESRFVSGRPAIITYENRVITWHIITVYSYEVTGWGSEYRQTT